MNKGILVDTAVTLQVNKVPLISDTDFKTPDEGIAYDESGMDLVWIFTTKAGVITQTAVIPTTAGDYDWAHDGKAMYSIEVPADSGISINNDTEGYGYFRGTCDGVLAFIGPEYHFAPANVINSLVDGSDRLEVDTMEVSKDETAADNLELQYDGTGLSGNNFPATQAQVSGIANVGAATAEPVISAPNGFVLTVGTNEQNDEDDTKALDGTEHSWDSTGNAIEGRYLFNIGGAFVPVSITLVGRLTGAPSNKVLLQINTGTIASPVWEERESLERQVSTTNLTHTATLYIDDVMTGVDSGKVQLRIVNDGTVTGASVIIDQLYCSKTQNVSSMGYQNGAVWFDSNAATTGTVEDYNGTVDNPVNDWADLQTLQSSLNLKSAEVAPGSTVALDQDYTNKVIKGHHYAVVLAGYDISGTKIINAREVNGIMTAATGVPTFDFCGIGNVTLSPCAFFQCGFYGTMTIGVAGTFILGSCTNILPHGTDFVIDFGAGLDASIVEFPGWTGGGIEIQNAGAGSGSYILTVYGWGEIKINANCSADTDVNLYGNWEIDNDASGITIEYEANYNEAQSAALMAANTILYKLDHLVAVADADDAVNDSIVAKLAAITGDWSDFLSTHSLQGIREVEPHGTVMRGTDGALTDKTGFSLSTAGILAIWNQLLSGLTTASTIGKKLADWILGSDSKAMLSTDAQTGVTIPTVTDVTNQHTLVEIKTQVTNALADIRLDHLIAVADSDDPVDNSIIAMLASATGDWSAFVAATHSLQAILETGNSSWITGAGGDATEAKQDSILADHVLMKGTGFDTLVHSLVKIITTGNANWVTGGGAGGASTVTLTIEDALSVPIADASVQIWNTGLTVLVSYATTDVNGQVVLSANDGSYKVKVLKTGYSFAGTTDLTVSGTTVLSIEGTSTIPSAPAGSQSCRVYEYLKQIDGANHYETVESAKCKIISLPYDSGGAVHTDDELEGTYDNTTGLLYWDVVQGAKINVIIEDFGVDLTVVVPAEDTARLSDI